MKKSNKKLEIFFSKHEVERKKNKLKKKKKLSFWIFEEELNKK